MAWLVLIGIGAVIGIVLRLLALALPIRWELVVALSIVGAVLGGVLATITQTDLFGSYSFYYLGALMALLIGGGEFLPFALTRRERRV
jgi:hypothetical protein